jgi:polyhydroxybutyrate depolymerase
VYASGCSNGGGMSYRLACEAADVIAAVAPVDFDCVVGGGCGNCSPSRPITTVQFRGTNDQLVNYDGAGAFIGAQQNFALWGELNACMGGAAPLQQSADGCESFPTCGAGAETVLCTVQNGTHCGSYGSFDIAQVAWDILENHALP